MPWRSIVPDNANGPVKSAIIPILIFSWAQAALLAITAAIATIPPRTWPRRMHSSLFAGANWPQHSAGGHGLFSNNIGAYDIGKISSVEEIACLPGPPSNILAAARTQTRIG